MLLTITNVSSPATDLGFLLHKNPDRLHVFTLSFGKAYVFYPDAGPDRCTVALLLEVDPVGLVRGRKGGAKENPVVDEYVTDRSYVASSFLSVAISHIFGTALSGRCKEKPDLVNVEWPLEVRLAVLPCRGGASFLKRLFEPLGYQVIAQPHPLDAHHPSWGPSPYFSVTLTGNKRISDLLTHLYVLIPVLDNEKHYWVGDDEIDKLLRRGDGWLDAHPQKDLIVRRYLKHQNALARRAMGRMAGDDLVHVDEMQPVRHTAEFEMEKRLNLNEQRMLDVVAVLLEKGARNVLDLGCGEGQLLRALVKQKSIESIVGMDVSRYALDIAAKRLRMDQWSDIQRNRLQLIQGSLLYCDKRMKGFDAAAIVEVIEHLDLPKLAAFEQAVFAFAQPKTVVVTTPNADYNVMFEGLPAGAFRHKDHRFEWSRLEFEAWSHRVAHRFGYNVSFVPVGPLDQKWGSPTQMAVFAR